MFEGFLRTIQFEQHVRVHFSRSFDLTLTHFVLELGYRFYEFECRSSVFLRKGKPGVCLILICIYGWDWTARTASAMAGCPS